MMFIKKLTASFVALILSMGTLVSVQASGKLTIKVDSVTAEPSETVIVPISISENNGICGAIVNVSYDKKLTLTKIEKGSALSALVMTKPGDMTVNPFKILWDGMDADNSEGVIAFLTFKTPDEKGKFEINISYDYGDIVGQDLLPVSAELINGSITTGEGDVPGDVEPVQNNIIMVDRITAGSGGSIDVPLRISGNTGICGAALSVAYDNRLTITQITTGNAFSTLTMTKPGKLTMNPARLFWDGTDEDKTDGVIATLTFNVPDIKGIYNISLSCTDGDFVDGALRQITPILKNGYINIDTGANVKVSAAGQTVILSGQEQSGKILVGYYSENDILLDIKAYNVADSINTEDVSGAAKIKVMWWDGTDTMIPVCSPETIDIK